MINQILKDIRRKISNNRNYFLMLIITLTIAIVLYSGSTMLEKTANQALTDHYKKMNIMDIKIKTNLSFDNGDKVTIKNIPGVKAVMMSKSLDAVAKINNEEIKVKLSSLPSNIKSDNQDYINRVTLIKGKYPTTINEALVEESFYKKNKISLNDLVTLTSDNNDDLRAKKVKIVGIVKESYQDFKNDENTSIYLSENEFNFSHYDDIYITLEKESYKSSVENKIKGIYESIKEKQMSEKTLDNQIAQESLNNIYSSSLAQEELNSEIAELTNNLSKTSRKLNDIKTDNLQILKKDDIKTFTLYKNSINETSKILKVFSIVYLILIAFIAFIFLLKFFKKEKKEIETLKKLGYDDSYIFIKYLSIVSIIDFISIIISLILQKGYVKLIGLLYKSYYGISMTKVITTRSILIISVLVIIISIIITFITYKIKNTNKFMNYQKILMCIMVILGINFIFTGYQISSKMINVAKKEYKNIIKYDLEVTKHSNEDINIKNNVSDKTNISKINIVINNKINSDLIIVKETSKIKDFISLDSDIKNKGIMITSSIANILNVNENDKIHININGKESELKIVSITKDFVNDYVYISPTLYKELTNQDIYYDTILIKVKNKDKISDLQNKLINSSQIKTVVTTTELQTSYKKALMPMAISILIISILGNIIILLTLYILILSISNSKNMKFKKLGYYNEEIIKMYCKKYKVGILLSMIFGITLSYIVSTILINNLSKTLLGLKNSFSLIPYILLLINFILITLIFKYWLNKCLEVKKM